MTLLGWSIYFWHRPWHSTAVLTDGRPPGLLYTLYCTHSSHEVAQPHFDKCGKRGSVWAASYLICAASKPLTVPCSRSDKHSCLCGRGLQLLACVSGQQSHVWETERRLCHRRLRDAVTWNVYLKKKEREKILWHKRLTSKCSQLVFEQRLKDVKWNV